MKRKSLQLKLLTSTEEELQRLCVDWFNLQYPNMIMWHTPNGARMQIGMAMKMKRMGMKKGVPDIFIAEPNGVWHGLFIELKREGGRCSDHQLDLMDSLAGRGYYVTTCYNFKEFMDVVNGYLKEEKPCRLLSK